MSQCPDFSLEELTLIIIAVPYAVIPGLSICSDKAKSTVNLLILPLIDWSVLNLFHIWIIFLNQNRSFVALVGLILMCFAILKAKKHWKLVSSYKGGSLVEVIIRDQGLYYLF